MPLWMFLVIMGRSPYLWLFFCTSFPTTACFIAQNLGGMADLSFRVLVTTQEKIREMVRIYAERSSGVASRDLRVSQQCILFWD